jgi:hypothetical protein
VEQQRSTHLRRTDGDGRDRERASYRQIAEVAYELFLDSDRDRGRLLECWDEALATVLSSPRGCE